MKPVISRILAICMAFFAMNAAAYNLPDTGQTKCYDDTKEIPCPKPGEPFYGQDANYTINPPSYTKLDAQGKDLPDSATDWAMVRDNVTGLIWENKQNMDGKQDYSNPHDADNTYTWYDSNPATNGGNAGEKGDGVKNTEAFINALNAAKFGGYSDWRMPTQKELLSVVDFSKHNPAIDTRYFSNTQSDYYWSSSTVAGDTSVAWNVYFGSGHDLFAYKSSSYYVRAVRGGQSGSFDNLVINNNGTVTDASTGLMWQQPSPSNEMNWKNALSYCESLTLAGYTDWRLPNVNELLSIVYNYNNNHYNTIIYFSSSWSSSSVIGSFSFALGVSNAGSIYSEPKLDNDYILCVRGGQSVSLTPPTLVSPENLAEISTSEYTFAWSHPYNDEYELIIRNDSNQTVFQSGRTKEKNFQAPLSGLSGGKTYKWYVLVYALGTSEKSSDRSFTYKGQSQITASTLVAPENNAEISSPEFTFAWTHPYYDTYELFIKDEAGATLYRSGKITDKSKKVVLSDIPLVNGKKYSWYVVVYANGLEKASEQRTFAYKASQQTITPAKLVSPENNAVITALEYKFSWQHDYDDEYALIITDMKDKELYNQRTKEKSMTVNFGDDLLAIKGETYKWYVVVYKANGQQASSDKRTFAFKDSSASGTCLEISNFTAYDKDQYMILPTAGKPAIATLTIRNVGDTVSAAKNAKLWIAPLDVPGKDCDSSYTEETQQEHIIKEYVFDVSLNNLAPGEKQVITQELVFYNACYTDKLMVILRSDKDKPLCQKSEYLEETIDFALYPNKRVILGCYLTFTSLVTLPVLEAAGISAGTIAAASFVVKGTSTALNCFDAGYKIASDENSGSVVYTLASCLWKAVSETLPKKVSKVISWFKFALEELYNEGGCKTEFFPPMWQLMKDVTDAVASMVSEEGHKLWTFVVGSPIDIEVLDAQGNSVYVSKEGELKNTIPNAVTSVINNGTEHPIKTIAIIDGDSYTVNVYGKAQGTANIHIIYPKADGTTASVDFENVNVTPDMKARMTISSNTTNYILNIDRNNDGTFEEQVTTDSIKAIAAAPIAPPVANAGPDITVSERNPVTLNGSSSTGAVSYQWAMLGKAPDWIETPKLSGADSPNPTFTAPEVGVDGGSMVFQLTVTDSTGKQSSDVCDVKINNVDSDLADDAEESGMCFISSAGNAPYSKGFWLLMAVFAVFVLIARKTQRNQRSESM